MIETHEPDGSAALEQVDRDHRRMVEALIFASEVPLGISEIAAQLPSGIDVAAHLEALKQEYATRGFELVEVAERYMFRTAADLGFLLRREREEPRKLSRAAMETLAIVAYHQPATRAEIEEIRGVGLSKGTLDVLLEAEWIRPRGRKDTPGRPILYGTTDRFLIDFSLTRIEDLPGISELRDTGLLDPIEVALENMLNPKPARTGKLPFPESETEVDSAEDLAAETDDDAVGTT
ncbi:MAG: SMC-Scp complex subunit ScpB [Pseudomonadota bacterium]